MLATLHSVKLKTSVQTHCISPICIKWFQNGPESTPYSQFLLPLLAAAPSPGRLQNPNVGYPNAPSAQMSPDITKCHLGIITAG